MPDVTRVALAETRLRSSIEGSKMRLRISRFIRRARAIWREMDYASRRIIEIRAALPLDDPREDFGPPRGSAFAR
jgi:hypothetical protein